MTLDLSLLQQLDLDEPTLEDIALLVAAGEPGRLLVCEPCGAKRFVPQPDADRYAQVSALTGWAKLHGRCAPKLIGMVIAAVLLAGCSDRPVGCRLRVFSKEEFSTTRCGEGLVRYDLAGGDSFLCCPGDSEAGR